MKNRQVLKLTDKYIAQTYARFPIALVRGKGTHVWDTDGKEYLDFVAGIAVTNLGHSHPAVVRAIQQQARKLIHVSNLYHIAPQSELAQELCRHSFADRVFFCNSGAEANEAAIKLARRYGSEWLGGKYEILSTYNSFHGRTLATLAATGQEKVRAGFDPLPIGFCQVPYNDLGAMEQAIGEKLRRVVDEIPEIGDATDLMVSMAHCWSDAMGLPNGRAIRSRWSLRNRSKRASARPLNARPIRRILAQSLFRSVDSRPLG